MKKIICFINLFFITISIYSLSVNSSLAYSDKIVYLNEDRVRIRDNDSLNSNCLSVLSKGTVAYVDKIGKQDFIDSVTDNWIYVKIDDSLSGWVWGKYLSYINNEIQERCKSISINSFKEEDYLYFKKLGIYKLSEILKLFSEEQIKKISKVYLDFSEEIDFENIKLFLSLDYLYIKNARTLNISNIPKNISRLILQNCSIPTLDLGDFKYLEGISFFSCKKIEKIVYPEMIDFVSFYDYAAWYEQIENLPLSIKELYICYNGINNFDFAKKLLKYQNLETVYLAGNPIPEDKQLHQYGNFSFFYYDEY